VSVVDSAQHARVFGVALYYNFLHPAVGESLTSRLIILGCVLISAATTFLTMRQSQKRGMMNQPAPDPDQPGAAMAASMSKNMMYIAPFFALTGLYWAFGLVLYWVTTNIWTLGQQHFLFRNLPVVGSATVGASAVSAASGNSAAVKSGATAKAVSAKAGTSAAAAAKSAAAKPAGAAKQSNTAKPVNGSGVRSVSNPAAAKPKSATSRPATAKAASTQPNDNEAVQDTPPQDTPPTANTSKAASNGTTGAAANGSGPGGPRGLLRFGKGKPEPEPEPAAPQTKVVRQQPVRQTRSKRSGNSGKR
jgi:hypothetical protein